NYVPAGSLSPEDWLLSRMKGLYLLARSRMDAAHVADAAFAPRLLSSGISYFQETGIPGQLIAAGDYFYLMQNCLQPGKGETILTDALDIISFHPYFGPSDTTARIESLEGKLASLLGATAKALWATETGVAKDTADGVANLAALSALHDEGSLSKFF